METRLELAEVCVSLCLSRMVKMEVWMRKTQNKMDGMVPEVIDLMSKDGEGEEAIGDVLGSPFLDLGPSDESEVALGSHVLGLLTLTQIVDLPRTAVLEELERDCTHLFTVGFEGLVVSQ